MNRRLNQYRGRLTPSQVAEGINLARLNAQRLVADARLLLQAGRSPTAASLAALSIEESGKVSTLRALALARSENEAKNDWRDYRSHTKKNVAWILPALVAAGARSLDEFRPLFDADADHPFLLDQVKQLALYSDCLGSAHWSDPSVVVNGDLAEMLVRTAELLCSGGTTTAEEIELWVKHVGPVWKGPMPFMRRAVANWHKEIVDRGLASHSTAEMESFLYGSDETRSRPEA